MKLFLSFFFLFFVLGLIKAKKYDWKDSNMELVGSEEDRAVKSKDVLNLINYVIVS